MTGVGVAARKMAPSAVPALPRLRLVRGGRRRVASRAHAATVLRFRALACALLVVACAGVLRVSLAARAAEAAVDAAHLREQLKAERLEGRELEADKSSLASPSRIEVLACETLNMDRPAEVCYLELPDVAVPAGAGTATADTGGAGDIVATLMDLAAGEAQVLLVGDMGLGTGR